MLRLTGPRIFHLNFLSLAKLDLRVFDSLYTTQLAMATDDFVMTIDTDDEGGPTRTTKTKELAEEAQLNPDFVFDLSGDPYSDLLGSSSSLQDYVKKGSKAVRHSLSREIAWLC